MANLACVRYWENYIIVITRSSFILDAIIMRIVAFLLVLVSLILLLLMFINICIFIVFRENIIDDNLTLMNLHCYIFLMY